MKATNKEGKLMGEVNKEEESERAGGSRKGERKILRREEGIAEGRGKRRKEGELVGEKTRGWEEEWQRVRKRN